MPAVACESMASRAGVRIAFPNRSAMIRNAAISQLPASASSGTATKVMAYPQIVTAQNLPVRSVKYPETSRRAYPTNSPAPATMPATAALAPRKAR